MTSHTFLLALLDSCGLRLGFEVLSLYVVAWVPQGTACFVDEVLSFLVVYCVSLMGCHGGGVNDIGREKTRRLLVRQWWGIEHGIPDCLHAVFFFFPAANAKLLLQSF